MFEKTISKETVYQGRIFEIDVHQVELADGRTSVREVVVHGPAVAIIARREDGRFLFIRQYRKSHDKICLEAVAGNCDPGEEALLSAKRELQEETGYQAQSIHSLGTILPSVGYCSETIEIFFAEVENQPGNTDFDVDEHIETFVMSESEMDECICTGEVDDGKTLAAWMLYKLKRG